MARNLLKITQNCRRVFKALMKFNAKIRNLHPLPPLFTHQDNKLIRIQVKKKPNFRFSTVSSDFRTYIALIFLFRPKARFSKVCLGSHETPSMDY